MCYKQINKCPQTKGMIGICEFCSFPGKLRTQNTGAEDLNALHREKLQLWEFLRKHQQT